MYRILLVEDDSALAAEMKKQIERYGNEVHTVTNFHDIMGEFEKYAPQLVLMDIMLPYKDGYYWTAEIRRLSTVPVVFVSSASDNMNIVMAVNMGGDDFIPKPVDAMVLNAKIQAVLRRTYQLTGSHQVIELEGAQLNLNDASLSRGEEKVELTRNEFRILKVLAENRGKIVSRDALMLKLWSEDCFVEENTLTVNVNRLRKKLESVGLEDVIITKPGSGYLIR